jgi:hypothetical protein
MSGVRDIIHPSRQPKPSRFNSSLRKTIGEDFPATSEGVLSGGNAVPDNYSKTGLPKPN